MPFILATLAIACFAVAAATAQGSLLQGTLLERTGPLPYLTPEAVAAADVNGDGHVDLLASERNGLRLLVGDGNASFRYAPNAFPAMPERAGTIHAADLDGDTDVDIMVAYDGQNRLLLGDGAGRFADVTAANLPTATDDTRRITLFDADSDGDIDALVVNSRSACQLLLNDGTGRFVTAPSGAIPGSIATSESATANDLDGDGDLDLVIANRPFATPGADWLWLNDGRGRFTDASRRWAHAPGDTWSIVAMDVEQDGDTDLLQIGFRAPALYLNDGSGTFAAAPPGTLPAGGDQAGVAIGFDADGDRDMDLWIGQRGSSRSRDRLWINDGQGQFRGSTASLPEFGFLTLGAVVADLDGDGDTDLVFAAADDFRILGNDGTGAFGEIGIGRTPIWQLSARTMAITAGDVDRDGDIDVVRAIGGFSGSLSQSSDLLLNDGGGHFTRAPTSMFPADRADVRRAELVDIDGDGDRDALLVALGAADRVLINDGLGSFAETPATGFEPRRRDNGTDLAVGDLDGDGDIDAIVANTRGADVSYRNDGSGKLIASPSDLPAGIDVGTEIELVDLDGDGDLDLAGVGFGVTAAVLLNDGTGQFSRLAGALPPQADNQAALVAGDVDRNGTVDLITSEALADPLRCFLGRGDGTFALSPAGSLPPRGPCRSLALGDVDEDGDLDLLIAANAGTNGLLLNDGRGVFVDASPGNMPTAAPVIAYSAAWLDIDEDGDLDAWIGTGRDLVLANQTRHLSARAPARVGKPLTLEVRGEASGIWTIAVGTGVARMTIAPLGVFFLRPSLITTTRTGTLDTGGRGEWTVAVPNDPSLLGAQAFWQGLIQPELRLTNRVATVVRGL